MSFTDSTSDKPHYIDKPANSEDQQQQQTIPADKKLVVLMGTRFIIDQFYDLTQIIGSGVYGVVAKGINKVTGRAVAIKKQSDIFHNPIDAKRILRELHILKFLSHKNIISLLDILRIEDRKAFNEVYLVMELMESNLSNVIKSKAVLTEDHIRYFIYQLLNGISFMHSASIVHRDLKPQNIFVNKKCELKIGDLNMARKLEEQDQLQTYYVITRWYRAPEVLLSSSMYTKAVDIWSTGCILAELIGRVPLFMGNSYMDQFLTIVTVMGRPKPQDFQHDPNVTYNLSQLVKGIPEREKIKFNELFPKADDQCLDLLDHMLQYNPKKRYTVEECLNHPYLEKFRKIERKVCTAHFDFSFDKLVANEEVLREQIYTFTCQFRSEMENAQANELSDVGLRMSQSLSTGSVNQQSNKKSPIETSQSIPVTATTTTSTNKQIKRERSHTLDEEDQGTTKLRKSQSFPSTTTTQHDSKPI